MTQRPKQENKKEKKEQIEFDPTEGRAHEWG